MATRDLGAIGYSAAKMQEMINSAVATAVASAKQQILSEITNREYAPVVGDGSFWGREWQLDANGNITDNGHFVGSLVDPVSGDIVTFSGQEDFAFPTDGEFPSWMPTTFGPLALFGKEAILGKDSRGFDLDSEFTAYFATCLAYAVRTGIRTDANTGNTYFYVHCSMTEDDATNMHFLKCFIDPITGEKKEKAYWGCYPVSKKTTSGGVSVNYYGSWKGEFAQMELSPNTHEANAPSNMHGDTAEYWAWAIQSLVLFGDKANVVASYGNWADLPGLKLESSYGNQSGDVNELYLPYNNVYAGLKSGAVLTVESQTSNQFCFGYEHILGHIQLTSDAIETQGSNYVKFTFKEYGTESGAFTILNRTIHAVAGTISGLLDTIVDGQGNETAFGADVRYPEAVRPFKFGYVENPWGAMAVWCGRLVQYAGAIREFTGRDGQVYTTQSSWEITGTALAATVNLGPFSLESNRFRIGAESHLQPNFGLAPVPRGGTGFRSTSYWYSANEYRRIVLGRTSTSTNSGGVLSYGCGSGTYWGYRAGYNTLTACFGCVCRSTI